MESLPSYQELKSHFPLLHSQRQWIEECRQAVRSILQGKDKRLLLIVGPCSIHDLTSAKEFAHQLKQLIEQVSSHFFIIMRVYCEKPRTTSGWKGFLSDPYLDGSHEIKVGIEWTRKLMLELTEIQVPIATEFLDPLTAFYYEDLITWGCIGARTVSSPIHRQLASALCMPLGMKNGVAGNISAAVSGAMSASHPHTFMRICEYGKPSISRTIGNPDAHIVLRGGEGGPNYDPSCVSHALTLLQNAQLPARILIDCSHHNSGKKYEQQLNVFKSIIHQIVEGNVNIRGLMLESHLFQGNQLLKQDNSPLKYGISITDPCLDWHSTAELILWGKQTLQDLKSNSLSVVLHELAPANH